jgi:hypothetical protein
MPQVVAKEAAASVLESPLIQKHKKYTEHEVPKICVKMKDNFIKVSLKKPRNIGVLTFHQVVDSSIIASLMDLKPVLKALNDLFASQFHEMNAQLTKLKTAQKDQVYVMIALTDQVLQMAGTLFMRIRIPEHHLYQHWLRLI